MQLSHTFSPIVETLIKLPHAKIAKFIGLALLVYITYLLAKMTWVFLDESNENYRLAPSKIITQSNSSSQNYSISEIHGLNLFGVYNQSVVDNEPEEVEDAPETNLKLTLTGVVASDEVKQSAAIIEHNGVQEIYAIDETINGTRAVLKNVHNDRVLIRHSGRLETLMLDGHDYSESSNKRASQRPAQRPIERASQRTKPEINGPNQNNRKRVDQRENAALTEQAKALKKDINEDPGKITDYLKIGPKRKDGKIVGYQLMPGRNPDFFKASGLKRGDVAVQMNGYDLSQPSEAAQALKALKQEREISLLVDRNGDVTEILFSIDE